MNIVRVMLWHRNKYGIETQLRQNKSTKYHFMLYTLWFKMLPERGRERDYKTLLYCGLSRIKYRLLISSRQCCRPERNCDFGARAILCQLIFHWTTINVENLTLFTIFWSIPYFSALETMQSVLICWILYHVTRNGNKRKQKNNNRHILSTILNHFQCNKSLLWQSINLYKNLKGLSCCVEKTDVNWI
jgi:hypothetical protein